MTEPTGKSERAAIVAWLRGEGRKWDAKEKSYRETGNPGPYLGGPPRVGFLAGAIERGEHLKESNHE